MFKDAVSFLSDKPQIGMISGFGSGGLMLTVKSFLMDDSILKFIGILGVWVGLMVAVFTMVIQFFKVLEVMTIKINKIKERLKK